MGKWDGRVKGEEHTKAREKGEKWGVPDKMEEAKRPRSRQRCHFLIYLREKVKSEKRMKRCRGWLCALFTSSSGPRKKISSALSLRKWQITCARVSERVVPITASQRFSHAELFLASFLLQVAPASSTAVDTIPRVAPSRRPTTRSATRRISTVFSTPFVAARTRSLSWRFIIFKLAALPPSESTFAFPYVFPRCPPSLDFFPLQASTSSLAPSLSTTFSLLLSGLALLFVQQWLMLFLSYILICCC